MARFARLRTPSDVILLFLRRFGSFLIAGGIVLVGIGGYAWTRTPVYAAESQIRIDADRSSPISSEAAGPARDDSGVVASAVRMIESRPMIEKVVDALGLASDPEWNGAGARTYPWSTRPPDTAAARRTSAIRSLSAALTVMQVEDQPIIVIGAVSRNRDRAAQIVNTVAEIFLSDGRSERRASAARQADALGHQTDRLAVQVRAADADLARYRARHGLVAAGARENALDQQTSALAVALANAQSDAAAARSRARAADVLVSMDRPDAVSEVLVSPVMTELRRQRAEIEARADDAKARYGRRHPSVLQVEGQLAGIDAAIGQEQRRIATGLASAATAASARSDTLSAELAGLKARQADQTRASVEADSLARVADARRASYAQLSQVSARLAQEADLRGAPGDLIVAGVPATSPVFPNKIILAALAMVAAPAAGCITVLALEAFDSKIHGADDISTLPGIRHLSAVGRVSTGRLRAIGKDARAWDYVLAKPMSSFAEALRRVRGHLGQDRVRGVGQVICISSALSGEGKSTLAVSLSRMMALAGDRVLLVDCDLRRTGLAGFVAARPDAGLLEVLAGDCALESAVLQDAAEGLDVLPLARRDLTPRDTFGDGSMARLLEDLRMRYDAVVLDAPPLLLVEDSVVLAALADKVVLAARWGSTRIEALGLAVARLQDVGRTAIDVILTGVEQGSRAMLGYRDQNYYAAAAPGYHFN